MTLPMRRRMGVRAALGALAALLLFGRIVEAGSVNLAWDPSTGTNVTGYVVYYGQASGIYSISVDVGNVTQWTQTGLVAGQQYFFAVLAHDSTGAQSTFSNEITTTIPLPT